LIAVFGVFGVVFGSPSNGTAQTVQGELDSILTSLTNRAT